MSCSSTKLPLLLERAGVRRVKSSIYIPLIPAFSLWRRSGRTCVDTYALREKVRMRGLNKAFSLCLFSSPRPSPAGEGDFFP